MPVARRGEIWLIDLGYAAKMRPSVVLIPSSVHDEANRPGGRSLLAGDSGRCRSAYGEIACKQAPTKTGVRLISNAKWNQRGVQRPRACHRFHRPAHHDYPRHAPRSGFQPGAFDAQGISGIPGVKLVRKLGAVDTSVLTAVE